MPLFQWLLIMGIVIKGNLVSWWEQAVHKAHPKLVWGKGPK